MSIQNLRKNFYLLLSLTIVFSFLASSALAASDLPGKGKKVQPARCTWSTGFFQAALVNQAMEDLGYEVARVKDLSNPIFYQAVKQCDVDYWANGWFPLHDLQLPEGFSQEATKVGTLAKASGLQGYLVSKDAVDKYNIKNLNDFKREEVKEAFDDNGDGKADLVACPPGWGCEKTISHHLDVYNLREHINPIKANYTASFADALSRYQSGENIFFYTWTPNWTIAKLKPGKDVMWINVPEIIPTKGQKDFLDAMVAEGVPGAVSDPVKMGFPANDICVVANKEFLSNNPAAERLFEVMKLGVDDIAAQNMKMQEGEDKQEDIKRHVKNWIKENQETYNSWLQKAKAAAN
jgi:glycine betaine/proline transport system substrate-binding protein